jgi:hypothetical protein
MALLLLHLRHIGARGFATAVTLVTALADVIILSKLLRELEKTM